MTRTADADWTDSFQGTRALPRAVRDRVLKAARTRWFRKGTEVFGPHNIPDRPLLLLRGSIRVAQTGGAAETPFSTTWRRGKVRADHD